MERGGDSGLIEMEKHATTETKSSIDPAKISRIAREVIAQLSASDLKDKPESTTKTKTQATAAAIDNHVITAQTIEQLPGNPKQAFIPPTAVITPAARDAARGRGITLQRTVDLPVEQHPNQSQLSVIDYTQPQRADAIHQQLKRRGFTSGSGKIILSDTPAKEVYFQCVKHDEVAVMIASIADIRRFAEELSPTLWVLDMQRLNFSAAVNAAAQIIQTKKAAR